MKILAFLLCLMVGVSSAVRCDFSKCRESNPMQELAEVRYMPSAQQLREYCPKALTFLDCNIDATEKCFGQSLDEQAASSDEPLAENAAMLLGVGALVRDICNPHSTLHKDYVANIECFRGFVVVGKKLCEYEAKETLEDFLTKSGIERGGLDDALNGEINCLEAAYGVTCMSIRLGESCGEPARKAFVNAVRRLEPFMDSGCKDKSLRNQFLEYSKADDEQMNKIKEVFDLFKRRR